MSRREVRGFDTSIITLGGGFVSVWQGDDVGVEMVSGSRTTIRDVRLHPLNEREMPDEWLAESQNKWCARCHVWRPRTQFSPDKRNRDKLHSYCKFCRSQYRTAKALEQRIAGDPRGSR